MASSDSTPVPIKNQAYRYYFPLYDADGDLVPSATGLDTELSKDGASMVDASNEATYITSSAGGYYIDLTAAEMNYDCLYGEVKSNEAKTLPFTLYPQEPGDIPVDIESISGDSTAADNLELQYDTTGLTGDTFPATQGQLGTISAAGAFNNAVSTSYVLTTGTQTANTYVNTAALDGVRHTHSDSAGALDLYYETSTGAGTAVSAKVTGYLQGSNDSVDVYAYDWVAAGWSQRGSISGQQLASNSVYTFDLLNTDTGTGSDKGKVRLRFYAASGLTSAVLAIDQILFGYNQASGSYQDGAVWIDTTVSNTGTTVGVDGISTNPVSTMAAARTIALATNLKRFHLSSGSEITLANTYDGYSFYAHGAAIHLGGQDITDCHFFGAMVDGVGTATSGEQHLHDCDIDNAITIPSGTTMSECAQVATITLGEAGDYFFFGCNSKVAGTGAPTLDMNSVTPATTVSVRDWSGGLTLSNLTADHTVTLGGSDCGTFTLNGADATVSVRGTGKPVANNLTGSPTVDTNGYMNVSAVDTELTSSHGAGSWTSSGLSGANSVTVTVQEADTTPIVGCTVGIYAATNTGSVLDQQITDASGEASFNLDDGTYAVRLSRYGYSFTVPDTLTVDEDPETATFTGTVITIPSVVDGWEDSPLRRQKVKYNSANTDTPLSYQRVLNGVKAAPSAATITIYAPGNSTALVTDADMSVSGSVATYSPDTTTVASWPLATGYRGEVSVTISGTTYTDKIVFDVVKFILHMNVGVDQLEAIDDRIASMEFAGSEDFERPISAARDILCAAVETKVLKDKRLIENMILDQTQLALPMRYLCLAMIFESKNNHEQSDRYRELYNETLRAVLSTIQYDDDQDGQESSTVGTTNMVVIGS